MFRNVFENKLTVDMPLHCLCAWPESKETIKVSLLAVSTNQLWMHKDHVPWYVRYMADEHGLGGAPVEVQDDSAVAVANCSVPDLNMHWDFKTDDKWTAIFVAGPHKGKAFIS